MNKIIITIISSLGLFFSSSSFAESSNVIATEIIPINEFLVTGASFIGICLFISGIYTFKQHSMAPQQHTIAGAIGRMFSGVALLSAGPMYAILSNSTIGGGASVDDRSILSVSSSKMITLADTSGSWLGEHIPQHTVDAVLGFVFLAGLFAFLNGLYMLKGVAGQERQNEGGTGKAFTHIIGGFITMNITSFSCMIGNTLGISMLCVS